MLPSSPDSDSRRTGLPTQPVDFVPVLASLVAEELAVMRRRSSLELELAGIDAQTDLGHGTLGTDSLELLRLASAVDEMFHLHETGVEEYLLRYRKVGEWAEIVCASLRKRAERITFRTSGSTGQVKLCEHRVVDLEQEVEAHAAVFTGGQRVLCLVPRQHIYGFLWAVMLPHRLGLDVLDARRWGWSKLHAQLCAGDVLVATPATWQFLSEAGPTFPEHVRGVTSGAPCPPALFGQLRRQGLDLTEVYGASETGGIGTRRSPEDAFALLPFWNRHSPTSLLRTPAECAVEVPDRLDWRDERHFQVAGRTDGAIQVLGRNVFPERIADCMRGHPAVLDCAVRLMRPDEGSRLKAVVVLHDRGASADATQAFEAWLRAQLPPHEYPASIRYMPELPRNAMGKLADWDCH